MLHSRTIRAYLTLKLHPKTHIVQCTRLYSLQIWSDSEEAEFDLARQWFQNFKKTTLPAMIAKTSFSRSSGPGGQKTNKTSSKATTVWPLYSISPHVPKVIYEGLQTSRFYTASSDSITIQCDSFRSQSENADETHRRLNDEITKLFKARVPGVTSDSQKKKVEQLQKAENQARLRMKKLQSIKKKSRSSGGSHGGDY